MKKLNNKGFTLVEILAVIVILGILVAITVPTITTIIEKNNDNNLKNIKKTIISAAKMYISDNRYNIVLDSTSTCNNTNTTREIDKIYKDDNVTTDVDLTNSKLPIKELITKKYIEGKITNPTTKKEMNDSDTQSYIKITYNCKTKDYNYSEPIITWQD